MKAWEKLSSLAKLSENYLRELYETQTGVSKLTTFTSNYLPSIFSLMVGVAKRLAGLSRIIYELALTRTRFPPTFNWMSRVSPATEEEEYFNWITGTSQPTDEEYFPEEMTAANLSFLFNVALARKTTTELAQRLTAKTRRQALTQRSTIPPELDFSGMEETRILPLDAATQTIAELRSRFDSNLAPSITGFQSALHEYGRQTILLTPPEMPKPLTYASPERKAPHIDLATGVSLQERSLSITPKVSTPTHRPEPEYSPMFSFPFLGLSPEASESFGYASQLPNTIAEQRILMVGEGLGPRIISPSAYSPMFSFPFLGLSPEASESLGYAGQLPSLVVESSFESIENLSLSSPSRRILHPSIEHAYDHPKPSTSKAERFSQISRLPEEISPALTSWIYGVSETLRGTGLSLSAVPIAVATAERVIRETLVQPISSFKTPLAQEVRWAVSSGKTRFRPKPDVQPIAVEAFRLPAMVASAITASYQQHPVLFEEATMSKTYEPSFEFTHVASEGMPSIRATPEVETTSKLPTVIALAAARNLISQRLQYEFQALTRDIQAARSPNVAGLSELGTTGPARPMTPRSGLTTMTPSTLPQPIEDHPPRFRTPLPHPTRLGSPMPTVQNTFQIAVSAESAEEDLRDLERKISRILSEQIRRYYGSRRL